MANLLHHSAIIQIILMQVVHEGLSDAWTAVKTVVNPVIKAFEDAFAFFAKLGAITVVLDIMKPVKEALDAILDALKPVMWALKAVECIFDKIVKPVIDDILKVTVLYIALYMHYIIYLPLSLLHSKVSVTTLAGMIMIVLNFIALLIGV